MSKGRKATNHSLKIQEFIFYIEKSEIDIPYTHPTLWKYQTLHQIWFERTFSVMNILGGNFYSTNYLNSSIDLFDRNSAEYALCYKLSQDHLELFFTLIRQIGGSYNNSTTGKFKTRFFYDSLKFPNLSNLFLYNISMQIISSIHIWISG